MLTNIVDHTRDCMGIIAGVQHNDGPLEIKYWGVRTHVALMPMNDAHIFLYADSSHFAISHAVCSKKLK